jgi:hypothetical protein
VVELGKRSHLAVHLLNHVSSDLAVSCDDGCADETVNGVLGHAVDLLQQVGSTEYSRTDIDLQTEPALELTECEFETAQNVQPDLLDFDFPFVEVFAAGDLVHLAITQDALDFVVEDLKDHFSALIGLEEIEDIEAFGGFDDNVEFVFLFLVFELSLDIECHVQVLHSPNNQAGCSHKAEFLFKLSPNTPHEIEEKIFGIGRDVRLGIKHKLIDSAILVPKFNLEEVGHDNFPHRLREIQLLSILSSGELQQVALRFH